MSGPIPEQTIGIASLTPDLGGKRGKCLPEPKGVRERSQGIWVELPSPAGTMVIEGFVREMFERRSRGRAQYAHHLSRCRSSTPPGWSCPGSTSRRGLSF